MTNNQNLNNERPPAEQSRRNVLGENLLTVITIIGVIGKTVKQVYLSGNHLKIYRWHGIRTYLKKFRQSMDGT